MCRPQPPPCPLLAPGPRVTRFADVAGVEDAKQELQEVVEFLQHPENSRRWARAFPRRSVPLVGPPGSGKTLLARAVAGEAGVPFFSVAGSEFVEVVVGVGARRVRDLFEQAVRCAPAIVFVDEIDAIGRSRGAGLGAANDEREQTLNQVLVQMDGFEKHATVVVIAATNRPDVLDPALLRPGRFDRRVVFARISTSARRSSPSTPGVSRWVNRWIWAWWPESRRASLVLSSPRCSTKAPFWPFGAPNARLGCPSWRKRSIASLLGHAEQAVRSWSTSGDWLPTTKAATRWRCITSSTTIRSTR